MRPDLTYWTRRAASAWQARFDWPRPLRRGTYAYEERDDPEREHGSRAEAIECAEREFGPLDWQPGPPPRP